MTPNSGMEFLISRKLKQKQSAKSSVPRLSPTVTRVSDRRGGRAAMPGSCSTHKLKIFLTHQLRRIPRPCLSADLQSHLPSSLGPRGPEDPAHRSAGYSSVVRSRHGDL